MAKTKHIRVDQDEIARLAHMNWLADGCPGGRDLNYWLEAESQLKATKHLMVAETQKAPSHTNGKFRPSAEKSIRKQTTTPELSRKR